MLFCLDLVSTAAQTAATDTAEAHTAHLADVDLAINQAGEMVEEAAADTAAAETEAIASEPAVPEPAAKREDRQMPGKTT